MTGPVSFEQSRRRQRVRLHDTRATFVTVSLANGQSEAWVQDRTGHKSSTMIAKYRRAARMAVEVGMGPFVRMDVAVGLAGDLEGFEGLTVWFALIVEALRFPLAPSLKSCTLA